LSVWRSVGAATVKKLASSSETRVELPSIPHAPKAGPEFAAIVKWMTLSIGFINALLGFSKTWSSREKAKQELESSAVAFGILLKSELVNAGMPEPQAEKVVPTLLSHMRAKFEVGSSKGNVKTS